MTTSGGSAGLRPSARWIVCVMFAVACGGRGSPIGTTTTTGNDCVAQPFAARRVVRLSLDQIATAIGQLVDGQAEALARAATGVDPLAQTFVPLASPREGQSFVSPLFGAADQMAQVAAQHVFDDFSALAHCQPATDPCAQVYVLTLAQQAYRRPLDPPERDELLQLLADNRALSASVEESAQYAVYAILIAPAFLYRSELGDPATASAAGDVALAPYEVATQLAVVTQGGLPDGALLEAARSGKLGDPAGVADEIARLLATPEAHRALGYAMTAYYGLNLIDDIVIDTSKVPAWNDGLPQDMLLESRRFLDEVLWTGALTDVLTSRTAFVNASLATTIYGIPSPAGAAGPTDFVRVELPAGERAGILTRAGFITARARTDIGDLVARGLAVLDVGVCGVIPAPPDDIADQIARAKQMMASNPTAREAADYRTKEPACAPCHGLFDPYGIALEGYDIIGRRRTTDDQGRPIDTATTLPAALDHQSVRDGIDLSQKLAQSPAFLACQAKSMLEYALADPVGAPIALDSCAVTAVTDAFRKAGDPTFAGLVRQVALSPAANRRLGGN